LILRHPWKTIFRGKVKANRAIAELLNDLNRRAFKKLPGCRHSVFIELDQPALKHLPQDRYQYAEWKTVRAGIDYHVEVKEHYYSVPYRFAKLELDARHTAVTVEVFHRGKRIAAHARSFVKEKHTTLPPHMPPEHQAVAGWDANRLLSWAQGIGPHTEACVQHMLNARRHPQQSYRACMGVLQLSKSFGNPRVEAACARALKINAANYRSINSILKNGLDRQDTTANSSSAQSSLPPTHPNVRGSDYFH